MSLPGVGRPGSLSPLSWLNSTWRTALCQILTGIQVDRVPRPCWIQCIALVVSAEVKNHVCSVQAPDPSAGPCLSVHTWCLLCFCEELLASTEEHQIRVVEVVQAADAVCNCSVSGFIPTGKIWEFTRAGTCQRAQSWGNHGAKWLLVSLFWKKLNDCQSLTGICWTESEINGFISSGWPCPALGLTWSICSWVQSAEGVFKV